MVLFVGATIGSVIGGITAAVTAAAPYAAVAGAAVGIAGGAGAFDPKRPDLGAAKRAEQEARRKKLAEIQGRRGRGSSIVTGGAGLTGQKNSSLGQSSLLGSG